MTTQTKKINIRTVHNKDGLKQKSHWYIMMVIIVIGVIAILIKGIYVFIQISHDQVPVEEIEGKQSVIFDVEKLETSLEYFNTKNERYVQLLESPPSVTDPS